ncbi:CaiB/BaiF CoA transferase family protein [Chloroflexota bacterium]
MQGFRVLEWASYHTGPNAATLLGMLGAEVIKIEDRERGDVYRGVRRQSGVSVMGPDGWNVSFRPINLNKKSITLDLKKMRAREIVYRLVQKSDVFLTNLRRFALINSGVDYETLSHHNPRLVYVHISGQGLKGPDSELASNDVSTQARSGIMTVQRSAEKVPFSPLGLADQIGSISAAYGALGALLARERFGIGQEVQASQLGSMIWLLALSLNVRLLAGEELKPVDRQRVPNPLLNVYRCRDGKWLCLAPGVQSDKYWPLVCQALGIDELTRDPRFENLDRREENSEEIIAILDRVFAQETRDKWLAVLKERDVFVSPVNNLSDLLTDPQVLENEYIVDYEDPILGAVKVVGSPFIFSETPARIHAPTPEFGQHTEEVLTQLAGYSWEEIDELKSQEVI